MDIRAQSVTGRGAASAKALRLECACCVEERAGGPGGRSGSRGAGGRGAGSEAREGWARVREMSRLVVQVHSWAFTLKKTEMILLKQMSAFLPFLILMSQCKKGDKEKRNPVFN